MKNKFFMFLLAIGSLILIAGCAKVPQAEIDAANAAIEEARIAEADIYVAEEFNALGDSMKVINEMIEAQKGKMFAKYTVAKEKLASVANQAATVIVNAETQKAEVEAEIESLKAEVQVLIAQNNELVGNAPKGKEGTAALEAIKSEIGVIETTVAQAAELQGQGKLLSALDMLKAADENAKAINSELESVMAKYASKKR